MSIYSNNIFPILGKNLAPFLGFDGKYHYLYITTEIKTGFIYIGKHSTKNWQYDTYCGSGIKIKEKLKTEKRSNFVCTILKFFNSSDDAYKEETIIVNKNFIKLNNVYNVNVGGNVKIFSYKKISVDKKKITCLIKYGVDVASKSQQVKNKNEETCMDRYGNKTYSASEEGKKRIKTTMLELYGVGHALQNKELQLKKEETTLERYGVKNFNKLESSRIRVSNQTSNTVWVYDKTTNKQIRIKNNFITDDMILCGTNRKKWLIISPNNEKIYIDNLPLFCKENNLNQSTLIMVANGKRSHHKKYKCQRYDEISKQYVEINFKGKFGRCGQWKVTTPSDEVEYFNTLKEISLKFLISLSRLSILASGKIDNVCGYRCEKIN